MRRMALRSATLACISTALWPENPRCIASPTVAATYHKAAYGHAKYQFLYPAASLATGTHWVTVIAVDSGGRSTTFGPDVFTVQ